VQLEGATTITTIATTTKFQFHIGAIRSCWKKSARSPLLGFNSILVQLEGGSLSSDLITLPSFNSILVQLEVGNNFNKRRGLWSFNSILVQLEGVDGDAEAAAYAWFQFHIGAIRRQRQGYQHLLPFIVSIPYWCN